MRPTIHRPARIHKIAPFRNFEKSSENEPLPNLPEQVEKFYQIKSEQSINLGNLILVRGELCTDLYCDGDSGPGSFERAQPLDTSLFRKYGLYVEMPYSDARKILLNLGWVPSPCQDCISIAGMPEATAGNAIGSAVLIKGATELDLTLTPDLELEGITEIPKP